MHRAQFETPTQFKDKTFLEVAKKFALIVVNEQWGSGYWTL